MSFLPKVMLMAESVDIAGITTSLTTALSSCATGTLTLIGAVLPIGITIFTAKIAIEYAKKFFSKIAS